MPAAPGQAGPRGIRRWLAPLLRLSEYGTASYPSKVRRRLQILNVMAVLVALFSILFAATYAANDLSGHRWAVLINLALVAAALTVPFAHRHSEITGAMILLAAEYAGLFALVALLGRSSGIQLNFVVVATVAFAVLGPSRPGLLVLVLLTGFALHVGAWFLFPDGQAGASPDFLAQLYVNSALTVFAVTAAIAFYAFWVVEQAEAETEALLRNVLPDLIVERLKRQPDELVADTHAEVSVLFSDIKSFVPLAHSLGALRTVEMLNDLVRGFDRLASLHGVEKIKTIGDAYMAVAGLPEPAADHAVRQARMALAMQESARETASRFGVEIVLRIGIATGPVMAGVIGTRKFSYDVWGDAVNLAARLEQTCEVGRVHISTATRTRLGELFQVRPRGAVPIKGLGPVETFTLLGPALGGPERPGRAA